MRRLFIPLLLLSLAPAPSMAQANVQIRQGFGISFGLGFGSAGLDCDGCDFDRETGLSGYLRIGGYVRPNLFIAGETNGWVHSEDGLDEQISFLSAVAQWYPQVATGFYLKGGLGLAVSAAEDAFDELSASGMGLTLGTGYDWRVGRNFSLTPYLNYLRAFGAEAELNGVGLGENLSTNVLQFGLGFTWH